MTIQLLRSKACCGNAASRVACVRIVDGELFACRQNGRCWRLRRRIYQDKSPPHCLRSAREGIPALGRPNATSLTFSTHEREPGIRDGGSEKGKKRCRSPECDLHETRRWGDGSSYSRLDRTIKDYRRRLLHDPRTVEVANGVFTRLTGPLYSPRDPRFQNPG